MFLKLYLLLLYHPWVRDSLVVILNLNIEVMKTWKKVNQKILTQIALLLVYPFVMSARR